MKRSTEDYPALEDASYWRRMGRDHGRREFPRTDGADHPLSDELHAALCLQVAELRWSATAEIEQIDAATHRCLVELAGLASRPTDPPPRMRQVEARRREVEEEVNGLAGRRERVVAEVHRQSERLQQLARRADAAYRTANTGARARPVEIAAADLTLPADLLAPLG